MSGLKIDRGKCSFAEICTQEKVEWAIVLGVRWVIDLRSSVASVDKVRSGGIK